MPTPAGRVPSSKSATTWTMGAGVPTPPLLFHGEGALCVSRRLASAVGRRDTPVPVAPPRLFLTRPPPCPPRGEGSRWSRRAGVHRRERVVQDGADVRH